MCLLVETIKLKNGKLYEIDYHNDRLNRSRYELFKITKDINLEEALKFYKLPSKGIFKIRIIYNANILRVDIKKYKINTIKRLKIILNNKISYPYKFLDRSAFTNIKRNISQDEEVIIVKNSYITDTTFSNLIFYNGKEWITPATYILNGTKRKFYLDKGIIYEASIKIKDLGEFLYVSLINTMLDIDDIKIPTDNILFP